MNLEEALEIREAVIESLEEQQLLTFEDSCLDWNGVIDSSVYLHGLRMFGSRKVTKSCDLVKVYQLICLLKDDGEVDFDPLASEV